jgi:uncharacterized protein (DUF58 family)
LSALSLALIKLAVVAAPLLVAAWWAQVYPSRRLVLLALVPGLVSIGLLAAPSVLVGVIALDALILAAAAGDLLTLPRRKAFSATREAGRIVSIRKLHPVHLAITNHSRRSFEAVVRDGVPESLHPEPAEFAFAVAGQSRLALRYDLRASRRGAMTVGPVHVRVRSRLGLWQRLLKYPVQTTLHVYPDMKQLSQYAVLARTDRLNLLGVRRTRRIGQDHDFERLRDYSIDDNYKHLDWRATARRRKLTVRDYQSSQAQRIVFLLDCGRMMTGEAAGLSLLDHAFNSMLMLSYVALRQGDSAGLLCFSDAVHRFVPPRGGLNQMNRLIHAVFDRFPQMVESRYDQAFRYLATHCRKRSLVVLVTNVIDEVNAHQIERYLANLVGRHLPLGILLRDRRLFEAVEAEQPRGDAFWQAAAAADILAWRHQVLTDLASKGVLSLDVFPDKLTAPLINQYLEIKARHLL